MNLTTVLADYLGRGWAPLPLARGTKDPLCKFKHMLEYDAPWQVPEHHLNGLLEPFAHRQDANVGILLRASGLVVVDCDSVAAVQEAIANTEEPCNNVVQSSKGAHFYYRRQQGCPPLRTVHRGSSQAIDILANGFAVAPPSVHKSGYQYRWVRQGELQDAPDWVVGMLSAIRERSIANTLLSPEAVKTAFPNTAAEALLLLKAIQCRDPRVAGVLNQPGTASQLSKDRSYVVWLTINTLIRLLGSDVGPSCRERDQLKNTIGDLTDESIAKVIWFGVLGSDTVGEKPRQRGWQWFCDEIARARLEIVAR